VASEDVVVELMTKCLLILYYAIEVFPKNKAHINSLDFVVGSCFSKILCMIHVKQYRMYAVIQLSVF